MSVLDEQEHCLICQYDLSKNIASYVNNILYELEHCLMRQFFYIYENVIFHAYVKWEVL